MLAASSREKVAALAGALSAAAMVSAAPATSSRRPPAITGAIERGAGGAGRSDGFRQGQRLACADTPDPLALRARGVALVIDQELLVQPGDEV